MKCLFIIQGEGRGHLTQAIALASLLQAREHSVVGALVGGENIHDLPAFFTQNFNYPTQKVFSPYLVYSTETKALAIGKTILKNTRRLSKYVDSMKIMNDFIAKTNPDIIINFYELLGGIHRFFFRPNVPMVCIAHQYLLLHRDFIHPKNQWLDRLIVDMNTAVTAFGSSRKLALSFSEMLPDYQKNIVVIPPLLRREITQKDKPSSENFILIYVTQASFAEEIIQWHSKNLETALHCFLHLPDKKEALQYDETLTFHPIDAVKFVEMMEKCRGLVSTAGFESICEAMYLGKPCMMIPIPKHYEQQCNALDAVRAGAGISSKNFDLSPFLTFLESKQESCDDFRAWQSKALDMIERELVIVLGENTKTRRTTLSDKYSWLQKNIFKRSRLILPN